MDLPPASLEDTEKSKGLFHRKDAKKAKKTEAILRF
jgi:hypothetical protein